MHLTPREQEKLRRCHRYGDHARVVFRGRGQSAQQSGDDKLPIRLPRRHSPCHVVRGDQGRQAQGEQQRHEDVGHREVRIAHVERDHCEERRREQPCRFPRHAPSEPEADLNPVAVYNRTAKEKRRDRWAESFADEEPVDAKLKIEEAK